MAMHNEWTEFDDWKQITSNLVVAEGQVFAFDGFLERWRVQMGSLLALLLSLLLLLAVAVSLIVVNLVRHFESALFDLLPALIILLLYGITMCFLQLQKLRELRAEATLARTAQEHARRRVLDRDLGVRL